jgi:hypothetical protein
MPARENQTHARRQLLSLLRGPFPGWKNRDGTGLIFRLMQRLGKPFFQFVRGRCFPWRRTLSWQSPTTRFRFIAFAIPTAARREARSSQRRNPWTAIRSPNPPRPDRELLKTVVTTLRRTDGKTRSHQWYQKALWQLPKRVAVCFLKANVAQIKALTVSDSSIGGLLLSFSSGRFSG